MTLSANDNDLDSLPPAMAFEILALILAAVIAGAFAAVALLPAWLPGVTASILGESPKAYWYLSRATAIVAYLLVWLSMVLGVVITNKMARVWPGGPTAFDLHQHASLLGLAFALFHALILMGDKYIGYSLGQVAVPFASGSYRPFWVGLGQTGFYLLSIVALSFYVRGRIGTRAWRTIHFVSFLVFGLALIHGVWSGTDSAVAWVHWMYWVTAGLLLFLIVYRILVARVVAAARPARPAVQR